jgi:hypothetical protein
MSVGGYSMGGGNGSADMVALALRISTEPEFRDQLKALVDAKKEADAAFKKLGIGRDANAAFEEGRAKQAEADEALKAAKLDAEAILATAREQASKIVASAYEQANALADKASRNLNDAKTEADALLAQANEAYDDAQKIKAAAAAAAEETLATSANAAELLDIGAQATAEVEAEKARLALILNELTTIAGKL